MRYLLIKTPIFVLGVRGGNWTGFLRTVAEYAVTIGAGILTAYWIVYGRF